jgi:hypothetical protein
MLLLLTRERELVAVPKQAPRRRVSGRVTFPHARQAVHDTHLPDCAASSQPAQVRRISSETKHDNRHSGLACAATASWRNR